MTGITITAIICVTLIIVVAIGKSNTKEGK